MKFYHKYQKALEEHGYRVDELGYVWDFSGNQAAGEDNYGNVQSKDPNVTEICRLAQLELDAADKPALKSKPNPKPRTKKVQKIVPALDADGNRIEDDPTTDVDESWVVMTVEEAIEE